MKFVIICGGVGTKMWPMSRSTMPKHFIQLLNGKSLFQLNWEALRKKYLPSDIFIQTNELQAKIAKEQVPEILEENIFIEPEMRNQGPATGFAAAMLSKKYPNEPFMLIQADVYRHPDEKFLDTIEAVGEVAETTNKYITGGFVPETVVKGVDYLIKGDLLESKNGVKIYKVAGYIDRSEEEKIKEYIGTDKLLLHANHTTMKPSDLMEMYKKYRSDWYEPLEQIANGADKAVEYAKMPKGAIEEITSIAYDNDEALVVELDFEWVDFGTWESFTSYLRENGLIQSDTNVIEIDSTDNYVKKRKRKVVALIGVSDLIVVDTGDALLIVNKKQTGKVGQIVDRLKEQGKKELY